MTFAVITEEVEVAAIVMPEVLLPFASALAALSLFVFSCVLREASFESTRRP